MNKTTAKEDIVVLYIEELKIKVDEVPAEFDLHKNRVYRAFYHKKTQTYRIVFEHKKPPVSGLIISGLAIDDSKMQLKAKIVTPENAIDLLEIDTDELEKVSEWLTSDNNDIDHLREENLVKNSPLAQLLDLLTPNNTEDKSKEAPEVDLDTMELDSEYDEDDGFVFHHFSDIHVADLERITRNDKDMTIALGNLFCYLSSTYGDKYANAEFNPKNIYLGQISGRGFNIGNAIKYLSRYQTDGYKKSYNIEDLYKAIHYLLFELIRRAK